VAQRVGTGINLLFHAHGTRRGEWSAARLGHTLPPGKTRCPLYRRLVGPQDRSGQVENLVPTGIRFRTVHPLVAIPTELHGPQLQYIIQRIGEAKVVFNNKKQQLCSNNLSLEIKKKRIKVVFGVLLFIDQKHGS